MGAQALRRDALRVLVRFRLIVRPSNAGAERGHYAASDFHAPPGGQAKRVRESPGLGVPRIGGSGVEEGSGCEEGTETVGNGGGGDHGSIVTDRVRKVNGRERNIIIFFGSDKASRCGATIRLTASSPITSAAL